MTAQVGVIGSGAAGMAAAFRLQQAGWRVRMLEAEDHLGGRMYTTEKDGFILDHGATILTSRYRHLLGIISDAELGGELVSAGSSLGIARDGEIHSFDGARLVRDFLGSRLISTRSKLKLAGLARDVLRARKEFDAADLSYADTFDTQSAGDYARLRLNREIYDYLVEPSTGALHGGRADEVSVVSLFFCLEKFFGTKFFAFRRGMGTYPQLLGRRFDVELGARVLCVEEQAGGVDVTWQGSDGLERTESMAGCVVAVPGRAVPPMLPGLDPWRADFLGHVKYAKCVVGHIALSRRPTSIPATYIMGAPASDPGILSFTMEHNHVPGRVPPGKGMVSVYSDSAWAEELMADDDDGVSKKFVEAMDRMIPGSANDVEFAVIKRWDVLGPTTPPGYWRDMRRFNEIRRGRDTLIQLAGDYFATSKMESTTASGERAARDLLARLTPSQCPRA
ncbi:MAG TPA: NAD(P)/FAD-dependent oxidoreductase [Acidimicrobiales bacterium]